MRRLPWTFAMVPFALIILATTALAEPRTCGTVEPPAEEREAVFRSVTDPNGAYGDCIVGGQITLAFHILHNGTTGNVPQAQIVAQVNELNLNYAARGYTFVLGSVDRTNNAAWFNLQSQADEDAMRLALAIDPANTLNIYVNIPYGYLGFAYFPWSFPEDSWQHAVFVDYRSLPGGSAVPYDLGRTATHEIGHYLGLYHTFQGGCTPPGDEIADTPAEASPAFGCPIGRNTCPAPGVDPIHNYMDYTDDACYTEFTVLQGERMCAMIETYRPSLLDGVVSVERHNWGNVKAMYR
jgi:hypothetical protein